MAAGPLREAVVLTNGQTESDAFENKWRVSRMGIVLPSDLDGTTLTFKVAVGGIGTYVPLYSAAAALVSITVAASRAYMLPADLLPFELVKFVFNVAQSPTSTLYVVGYGD